MRLSTPGHAPQHTAAGDAVARSPERPAGVDDVALEVRSVAVWHRDRLAIRPLKPPACSARLAVWRAGERPTPAAQAFRAHLMSAMRT
jgi:hypothetical protein